MFNIYNTNRNIVKSVINQQIELKQEENVSNNILDLSSPAISSAVGNNFTFVNNNSVFTKISTNKYMCYFSFSLTLESGGPSNDSIVLQFTETNLSTVANTTMGSGTVVAIDDTFSLAIRNGGNIIVMSIENPTGSNLLTDTDTAEFYGSFYFETTI